MPTAAQDPTRLTASVAMATFNGARHIAAQLTSIGEQTRPPDQLVVVDDGSTDATVAIVRDLSRRLPFETTIVDGGSRAGPVGNFGRAIRRAEGDVTFLCDQDDVWRPDKVAMLMGRFEEAPRVGGIFTDGSILSDDARLRGRSLWALAGFTQRRQVAWRDDAVGVLLRGNVVTGASIAFRSQFRDLLLPLPVDGWHDLTIGVLLACSSTFQAVRDPLISYRLHDGNAAGLPTGARWSRVVERPAHISNLRSQERHWRDLRARLRECGASAEILRRVDAKLGHVARRRSLPSARLARLRPCVREASRGGYAAYSGSRWSLVRDVVGP